jgi:DNA polymerase-3 subunit epsilon
MHTRQIIVDTETTGLDPSQGHRIIEIGCVELVNRRLTGRRFHRYLQPDRPIAAEAVLIHGITTEFLADKPRFAEIAAEFLEFVKGAELIIHNAPFDIGFLDQELRLAGQGQLRMATLCRVLDTLELARQRHPGQKNTLDALCKRYAIDNSQRRLHGALLDAEILADVYLAMTREQVVLGLSAAPAAEFRQASTGTDRGPETRPPLTILRAAAEERAAHHRYLELLDTSSDGNCLWKKLTTAVVTPDNTPDTRLQNEPPLPQ